MWQFSFIYVIRYQDSGHKFKYKSKISIQNFPRTKLKNNKIFCIVVIITMILNLYKWWGCHQRNIIWLFFNSLSDIQWKFSTINNSYRTIEGGWNKIIIIILPLTIWSTMNFKLNLGTLFSLKILLNLNLLSIDRFYYIYCIIGWVNICINSFTSRYWWGLVYTFFSILLILSF